MRSAPKYSLSIVLPVYNEPTLLRSAVDNLRDFLSPRFIDWEIVIVESGSTDGTPQVCDELAAANPRVRVVHEKGRNGFGSALQLGFRSATMDLVLMTTADQPFPLEAIDRALPLLDNHDCVLSYRSKDPRHSLYRKFQSFVYNIVARLALGIRTKHVNSAFKLYRRSVIQSFELSSRGWFIDAEIVYWITRRSVPYAVIPVELIERTAGQSTVRWTTALGVIKELREFRAMQKQARNSATPR